MAPGDPATEFLNAEQRSWERFDAQVARVADEDREVPAALERWSVKDLVWHCAHWAEFAAIHAESAGDGPFADPFDAEPDEVWDAENAGVAAESSAMTWAQVRDGADAVRARLRAVFAQSPALDRTVIAWMADETWVHYDEHAAHVAAFADARSAS
jgi:Mycothiol maleylpyruvate isomerase N-terminal domain